MNLIGKAVTVVGSRDPTKRGRVGLVILETAKTLRMQTANGSITVEKSGSVFLASGSGELVDGDELSGRLEDRWGRRQ